MLEINDDCRAIVEQTNRPRHRSTGVPPHLIFARREIKMIAMIFSAWRITIVVLAERWGEEHKSTPHESAICFTFGKLNKFELVSNPLHTVFQPSI